MADVTDDDQERRGPYGAEPDAGIPDARTETARLDRPRPSIAYVEPTARAEPPTSGFTLDPGEAPHGE